MTLRKDPPAIIAIDGPAASGKSTLGRRLADALGYLFFDTGVMYRAVTWLALQRGLDLQDEAAVASLAEEVQIDVRPPSQADGRACDVVVDHRDITWETRRPEVDANVSLVSAYPRVRRALTAQQRRIGLRGRVVMVGRDIGTVVLPEADLKIYLDASAEERARRRNKEQIARGGAEDFEQVLAKVRARDRIDSTRAVAPLRPAANAVMIHSDDMSADEVFERVRNLCLRADVSDYRLPLHSRLIRPLMKPVFRALFHLLASVKVSGKENVPYGQPYIAAINHISIFDPPFALAFWPEMIEVIGAADVFAKPGQGPLLRLYGAIPVHRGEYDRALFDRVLAVLRSGLPLLMAPEGGRSHVTAMRRAKPGIAYIVERFPVAVVPVGIFGTTSDFWQRVRRGRRPRLELRIGRPLHLPCVEGKGAARRQARQRNADLVMAHIAGLLPEDYRGEYAATAVPPAETGQ